MQKIDLSSLNENNIGSHFWNANGMEILQKVESPETLSMILNILIEFLKKFPINRMEDENLLLAMVEKILIPKMVQLDLKFLFFAIRKRKALLSAFGQYYLRVKHEYLTCQVIYSQLLKLLQSDSPFPMESAGDEVKNCTFLLVISIFLATPPSSKLNFRAYLGFGESKMEKLHLATTATSTNFDSASLNALSGLDFRAFCNCFLSSIPSACFYSKEAGKQEQIFQELNTILTCKMLQRIIFHVGKYFCTVSLEYLQAKYNVSVEFILENVNRLENVSISDSGFLILGTE